MVISLTYSTTPGVEIIRNTGEDFDRIELDDTKTLRTQIKALSELTTRILEQSDSFFRTCVLTPDQVHFHGETGKEAALKAVFHAKQALLRTANPTREDRMELPVSFIEILKIYYSLAKPEGASNVGMLLDQLSSLKSSGDVEDVSNGALINCVIMDLIEREKIPVDLMVKAKDLLDASDVSDPNTIAREFIEQKLFDIR